MGKAAFEAKAKQEEETARRDREKSITSPKPANASSFGGGGEQCFVCGKTVYHTERFELGEERVVHKACLKCSKCRSNLTHDTCVVIDQALFCKVHAKEKQLA